MTCILSLARFCTQRDGETGIPYDEGGPQLAASPPVIDAAQVAACAAALAGRPVRVTFETPTRIKAEGRMTNAPDFGLLAPALLRRMNTVHYFFCGGDCLKDVRPLLDAARQVETLSADVQWPDWTRCSARQDNTMQLGGLVGAATYSPIPGRPLHYLCWDEFLHIGKASAFGLGKYRLDPAE